MTATRDKPDSPPGDPFAPGLLSRLPERPRRVVVLRASRIGDIVCAAPALRALRRALPEAEISIITLPLLLDLVQRLPHADQYIAFPGFPGIAEHCFDARQMARTPSCTARRMPDRFVSSCATCPAAHATHSPAPAVPIAASRASALLMSYVLPKRCSGQTLAPRTAIRYPVCLPATDTRGTPDAPAVSSRHACI